ncbi:MAG: DUF523 domain-containing protein [Eubacteriaceae bacterium]|nr:DUF523 domain-containing protein [Eubacteriaceae bacterium]
MAYIVSKCLFGYDCKYDGTDNGNEAVKAFCRGREVVLICPEQFGGLPTPRDPSEIRVEDGKRKVYSCRGEDVTRQFETGALLALRAADLSGCELCILKESSPSCGVHDVYDGTFSGRKIPSEGITAAMLREAGYRVISEKDVEAIEREHNKG